MNDFKKICKFYNYYYFQSNYINQSHFYDFCKYDYIQFIDLLFITCSGIDINSNAIIFEYLNNEISIYYKFSFILNFYRTPICAAVEKGNKEIVEFLMKQPNLNINAFSVLKYFFNTIYIIKKLTLFQTKQLNNIFCHINL